MSSRRLRRACRHSLFHPLMTVFAPDETEGRARPRRLDDLMSGIGGEHVLDFQGSSVDCFGAGAPEQVSARGLGRRGGGHDDGGATPVLPAAKDQRSRESLSLRSRPQSNPRSWWSWRRWSSSTTSCLNRPWSSWWCGRGRRGARRGGRGRRRGVRGLAGEEVGAGEDHHGRHDDHDCGARKFLRRFASRCICSILARRAAF